MEKGDKVLIKTQVTKSILKTTTKYYKKMHIQNTVEYRKIYSKRMLRVFTMDLALRTFNVDNSMTVQGLVKVICNKIGIPSNNDFSLAFQKKRTDNETGGEDTRERSGSMTRTKHFIMQNSFSLDDEGG